jgi:hypothetical protein
MVEPPGTAPGSVSPISRRVYRHSRIAPAILIIAFLRNKSSF